MNTRGHLLALIMAIALFACQLNVTGQKATAAESELFCPRTDMVLGELQPDGVHRESVELYELDPVDASKTPEATATPSDTSPGTPTSDAPRVFAIASVTCIDAGKLIEYEDLDEDLGETIPRSDIPQRGETLIVMLDGEMEVTLLLPCAIETAYQEGKNAADQCQGQAPGTAFARLGGPEDAKVDLAVGTPKTIRAGATLFLSDVTVSIRTPDTTIARFTTYGTYESSPGGGGCPKSCWEI